MVDAATGAPVTTYNMDGVPAPVVTNSQGYVSPFQCDPGVSAVLASFGSVTLPLIDQAAVLQAGAAAVAAQAAAEDAAELVGAPADLAIAAAVQALNTQTRAALNVLYGDAATAAMVNTDGAATRNAVNAILAAHIKTLIPTGQTLIDTGWIDLDVNAATYKLYSSQKIQVRRIGNVVLLNGVVSPLAAGQLTGTVCTVPAGMRPKASNYTICQGSGNDRWMAMVSATGNVDAGRYGPGTPAVGTWLPFSLMWFVD